MYKIYVLKNENGEEIYVGVTTQTLKKRLQSGYKCIDRKLVTIHLIEETDDKTREEYWRNHYESIGCKLLNKIKGIHITDLKAHKKWVYNEWMSNPENKDRTTQNVRKWQIENKEKLKKYMKEYQQKNKVKLNEYFKEYKKKRKGIEGDN